MSAAANPRCTCGAPARYPGQLCDGCQQKAWRDERLREVGDATMLALPDRPRRGVRKLRTLVKDPTAVDRVDAALAARVDRILLIGDAGLGKTLLAVHVLGSGAYGRGLRGVFVDAYSLAFARANGRLGEEPELVRRARDAGVLVIDDLGAEPNVASSPIPEVIHHRHAATAMTVITSGFPLDALEARYGAGVFRRLVEDAEVVELQAPKAAR